MTFQGRITEAYTKWNRLLHGVDGQRLSNMHGHLLHKLSAEKYPLRMGSNHCHKLDHYSEKSSRILPKGWAEDQQLPLFSCANIKKQPASCHRSPLQAELSRDCHWLGRWIGACFPVAVEGMPMAAKYTKMETFCEKSLSIFFTAFQGNSLISSRSGFMK